MRVLEQIKIDACCEELPAVSSATAPGGAHAQLGTSHQCTEDVARCAPFPNIGIVPPADRFELPSTAGSTCCRTRAPAICVSARPTAAMSMPRFSDAPVGDLLQARPGKGDWAIIATGSTVVAARRLRRPWAARRSGAHRSSIPSTAREVESTGREFGGIFVVEEHPHGRRAGRLAARDRGRDRRLPGDALRHAPVLPSPAATAGTCCRSTGSTMAPCSPG